MALVKIESGVQLIGNASVKKGINSYSLIEFENGQILKDVDTYSMMDNFFQRTIKTNDPVTLWFQKSLSQHTLLGLKIGDKTYVNNLENKILGITIIGLLTTPIGFGFLLLFSAAMDFLRVHESKSIIETIIFENPNAQKL